jgi:polysaccharide export outer membrane protein
MLEAKGTMTKNVMLGLSSAFSLSLLCTASTIASTETPIHAGDKVHVTVYNHPDLSIDTVVTGTGEISLPIAGNVTVEGLNPSAAAFKVALALQPALRRPSVAVDVTEQVPQLYFTGSLMGVQPYAPGETLVAAVGSLPLRIGDVYLERASEGIDLRDVRVQRGGNVIGSYDLEALGRVGDPGPRLQSGDVIEVANKPVHVSVGGVVKTPGSVYLYPTDTLAQAVEQSGGFDGQASLTNVVLHRNGVDYSVSAAGPAMTSPARDGDTLTIQPAPHVNVIGMVAASGNYPLQGNPSLLTALYQAGGPNKWADVRHVRVVHLGVTTEHDVSGLQHGDTSANIPLQDGDVVFVPEGHRIDPTPFLQGLAAVTSLDYLYRNH